MCDCYTAKCAGGCEANIEMHIADFCTARENVHPYCISCTRKLAKLHKKGKGKHRRWPKEIDGQKVFVDKEAAWVTEGGETFVATNFSLKKKHQEVVILCDDHKAHGISLN